MAQLGKGPLEHLKYWGRAVDRAYDELEEADRQATCRREFDALVRAAEADGEATTEWASLRPEDNLSRAKSTDLMTEEDWGHWNDFIKKCARKT